MKILILGNNNPARDEFADKLGEAFGLPVFHDGEAEIVGAARLEDGVYVSSTMTRMMARGLFFDVIADHFLVPKDNKVERYKMTTSRIWGVYCVDEKGQITDTPATGSRGRVFEYLKRGYALTATKRINEKAGKTIVRPAIMKEFITDNSK